MDKTKELTNLLNRMRSHRVTNLVIPLYHISFDKNLPNKLVGRLPAGSELSTETTYFSEPDIPRVSFSTGLIPAFRGVFSNLSEEMITKGSTGITYQVYEAKAYHGKLLNSSQLLPYVHDAELTREVWIVGEVMIELIGTVTFSYDLNQPDATYKPFGLGKWKDHSPMVINATFKEGKK